VLTLRQYFRCLTHQDLISWRQLRKRRLKVRYHTGPKVSASGTDETYEQSLYRWPAEPSVSLQPIEPFKNSSKITAVTIIHCHSCPTRALHVSFLGREQDLTFLATHPKLGSPKSGVSKSRDSCSSIPYNVQVGGEHCWRIPESFAFNRG
jgi:hypothetical protein